MANNPISNIDPNGEEPITIGVAIAIGALFGGATYTASIAFSDGGFSNWNWGQFIQSVGIGAATGAASFGAGTLASNSLNQVAGFGHGLVTGAAAGAAGGFVGGAGNAWMNGASFSSGLKAGGIGAAFGGVTGGVLGGIDGARGFNDLRSANPRVNYLGKGQLPGAPTLSTSNISTTKISNPVTRSRWGKVLDPVVVQSKRLYLNNAKDYLGVVYSWGGFSCNGIDCSGLVQKATGADRRSWSTHQHDNPPGDLQQVWDERLNPQAIVFDNDLSSLHDVIQPGDVLNWPGEHAVFYSGIDSRGAHRILHAFSRWRNGVQTGNTGYGYLDPLVSRKGLPIIYRQP